MRQAAAGCGGHAGSATELRAVALAALDRLAPVVERVRAEPADPVTETTCAVCPLCALLAVLRGERPELAVRLAEHTAGLLAVLRAALEEGDPAAGRPPAQPEQATPAGRRVVQHIPIERVPVPGSGPC